ncbi:hypothetical protein [Mycoplasma suis]|uniref:Uncharacterized protein n=1 Tax=Mycoplasma suis (strain Illinois) TaxID=768700 RepID=F0QRM9_MYCSL|nr:hypothetical protein [Mycoplasma suis]ADX98149.1 hypothetical protein MSU_0617 [Mycoplasma suis str. Illinois]
MLFGKGLVFWVPVAATLSGGALLGGGYYFNNNWRETDLEIVTVHSKGFGGNQPKAACLYREIGGQEDIESPWCDDTYFMKTKSRSQANSYFEMWIRGKEDEVVKRLKEENLLNYGESIKESEWTTETKETCIQVERAVQNEEGKVTVFCKFEEENLKLFPFFDKSR